ncbi:BREX-3 system P-loop-containing protein BrxF [Gemmatimonadota bacterium]
MSSDILHRIAAQVPAAASLYHRLVLVVGSARTGKTSALRALAKQNNWPLINVNLVLSDDLTP